ncbi:hypothetical protein BGZ81_007837 [Podila clonocystis]|nr:hypothetical protein BGZ81_007837 [Podila clonocystis]
MDAPPSLVTLPLEVQNIIFQHIGISELPVCAKINKACNSIVTPLIWSTLDIKLKKLRELFMRVETQQALKRNAGYVRDLHINVKNMAVYRSIFTKQKIGLDTNATICTNLSKLRIYGHPSPDATVYAQQNLVSLVRQNQGLAELRISTNMFSITAVKEMICALPRLRQLRLVSGLGRVESGLSRKHIKLLLSVLPETIEDITFTVDNSKDKHNDVANVEETMPSFPALRRIAFEGDQAGVGNSILLPLLRACSKLTSFKTAMIQPFRDDNCRAALAQLGIFLERIEPTDLPRRNQADDSEIATTIYLSAGHMNHIDLRHCKQAGRLTVAAILDNCETLEYLNLSGNGDMPQSKIRSQDLQMILSKAPRLKVFITITSNEASGQFDAFLDAEDILGSEWATTSLLEFNCGIVVPRPDQHQQPGQPEHDEATLELEQSRAIQRQVYARLAMQKRMHTLRLGPQFTREAAQAHHLRNSLEMNLESGLGQLCDLKNMMTLRVTGIDQRIRGQELDWMYAQWPEMGELGGLFPLGQQPVPENESWIQLHDADWVWDWPVFAPATSMYCCDYNTEYFLRMLEEGSDDDTWELAEDDGEQRANIEDK